MWRHSASGNAACAYLRHSPTLPPLWQELLAIRKPLLARAQLCVNILPRMLSEIRSILPQVPPDTQGVAEVLRHHGRAEAFEHNGPGKIAPGQSQEQAIKVYRACTEVATV